MKGIKIHKTSFVDDKTELVGDVVIGKNCTIKNSRIINSQIGDNTKIVDSNIEDSKIKNNVTIGPYSHLRPNCVIDDNVHIGNFVEIKNSYIGKRTKIPHLSYVGDAIVGEDNNIGCGVIFCNYDGKNKSKTFVGSRVFIGSNCNIVAPVVIEDESFIAAGTTVTNNVEKGKFCIGRVKNEVKDGIFNQYLQNFVPKPKYFGTDGIRGIYGKDLTCELATKVGFSLTKTSKNPRIVVGMDTRPSGKELLNAFASGVCCGGGSVYYAGVISTPGVAYLTRFFGFDYGVVITASHNPVEYNGIKIFDKNGYKINENQENLIEKRLFLPQITKNIKTKEVLPDAYFEYIFSVSKYDLSGIKIFLDCSNGALGNYATRIFEKTGAKVISKNLFGEINKDASVLDVELFAKNMKEANADIGFCFDGDGDRVMCITSNGRVLDGDDILYILARYKKQKCVVGTIMSNLGIEKSLNKIGAHMIRTNVGDRNIARVMKSKRYTLGAEESGHVIIGDLTTTGDGLLTAMYLMNIYKERKDLFDCAEKLYKYPTKSCKYKTNNLKITKNKDFQSELKHIEDKLKQSGRIIVRPSGTEPVIRITVEHKDDTVASKIANEIIELIKKYE